MAVRRFGPTRGAGTRIEEQAGDKTLLPAALGWVGYAAIFEKGPVGEKVLCSTKAEFLKRMGGIIPDSQAPDCALDFYDLANGAGGIVCVRVTDGNELPASTTLYARRASGGFAPMGRVEAKNGGRWGGKERLFTDEAADAGSITETTLTTGIATFVTDEWKGGYLEFEAIPNKRYPIIGNTASGVISVSGDATMKTDWGAGPGLRYYLTLENESKGLAVLIADGEESVDTEFSLEIYLDGAPTGKKYGNLSSDPASARYWVNLINNDDDNDFIQVVDLWTGAHAADVRPANYYGTISTITPLVLTAAVHSFVVNSAGGGNPTVSVTGTTDSTAAQAITITMSSATAGTAVSDRFGALGAVTLGTPFAAPNRWTPGFTVTAGSTALSAGDILVITLNPFRPHALKDGFLYPDKVNAKRERYRIVDNTHKTITVAAGNNLTTSGAVSDRFMVIAPQPLVGGRDGNADIVDSTYENAWDPASSPFNDIVGMNLGLVKFATPGVTSTTVQRAGRSYAEAINHQYRVEIPSNITTENGALEYINDTLGRSDYQVVEFPSYADVLDPDPAAAREGKRKRVSLTGMIHGREARMAADYDGYHRAAAGLEATLPRILALPTRDRKLNEELLNPAGVNIIKKVQGNFIIWGDRTCHVDSNWRFKHQREQMSHYEHVLQENFDFIIFSINDDGSDTDAMTALIAYFLPEHTKRALRGKNFQEACVIKIDSELNTDATRAQGDKIASISLKLADVTERFIIRVGKAGVFESVGT